MADAKAPELAASDATTPTTTPPRPSAELTDDDLDKVSGGFTNIVTNIANMKHESLKGIAQNLRG